MKSFFLTTIIFLLHVSFFSVQAQDCNAPAAPYVNWGGCDKSYQFLPDVDLTGANLSNANLTYTYLPFSNLSGANLSGAVLYYALLSFADLSGADLSGANLTGVQSVGIIGSPTLPAGWLLVNGYLLGPDARVTSADLSGANLSGANLKNADLYNANLNNANLYNVNLNGANLNNTNLTGATLTGVVSGGITGTPAALPDGWVLVNGYLVGPGANLTNAILTNANLFLANLSGANLTYADLTNANLSGANLINANLSGANLTNANLTNANLRYANLINANLSGANLTGATLYDATLSGATLTGVLSGGIIGAPNALPAGWALVNGYLVTPFTATQSQVNTSCNGGCNGSATVVASGGAAPYTYAWSPSGGSAATASGLCAGTYTCTITDNASSTITKSFNITQPSAIVVSAASQTNIPCFDFNFGAASINLPTGGTAPYTYNWTPGNPTGDGTRSVTGLSAGTWTCTVTDANSCTATKTFNITQPSAIVVSVASQTNVSCNGGNDGAASINTPTGGTPGYTYNWTPGNPTGDGTRSVTGLSAGDWTCTVTDANGCIKTAAVLIGTLNTSSTPITAVSVPSSNCPNTNVTLTASGGISGTGSIINWYSGPNGTGTLLGTGNSIIVSPSLTTTYYVRREGLCNTTSDFSVVVNVKSFSYAANGTSSSTYCTDKSGWNHFYVGDEIILSVRGNLSSAGTITATIQDNDAYYFSPGSSGTTSCSCPVELGEVQFEMERNWNLNLDGGSLSGLYEVRFYYEPSERSAVITAASNWITAYADCGYTYKYNAGSQGLFWFKNQGSAYTAPDYDDDPTFFLLSNGGNGTTPNGINYTTLSGLTSFSGGSGAIILVPDPLLPIPSIAPTGATGNTTICNGGTTALTVQGGSAGSGAVAEWFIGSCTGPSAGTGNTINVSPTSTTTYYVRYNGTCNVTSCGSVTVTVNQAPPISITPSSGTLTCATTSIDLVASGGVSYLWDDNSTSATRAVTSGGNYSVTVTDANGCTASASAVIGTNTTAPTAAQVTGINSICTSGNTTFTASASGTSVATTYAWSGPSSFSANTATINNLTTAGLYTCIISNGNGCSATASSTLTVNPLPTASTITAGGATTFCAGGSVTLSALALPLNNVNGATLAVGLRKLKSTYTGPALRLRRSSDNQEQDFGFLGDDLDKSAISTWLNGADGFCTTIYDQSGNGGNVAQSNVTAQPIYVASGINNKPILRFTTTQFMVNSVNYAAPFTAIYGARMTGTSRRLLSSQNNNWFLGYWNGKMDMAYFEGFLNNGIGNQADNSFNIYAGSGNGNVSTVYKNGTQLFSDNGGLAGPNGIRLNGSGVWGELSDCDFTDVMLFGSELSIQDIAKLNTSISDYYTINNAISYLWSNGATTSSITATTAGDYSVTVTNSSGCSAASAVMTVTENPLPTASTITAGGATTFCSGGSVTLSGNNGGVWSTGATSPSISVTTSGTYSVTTTNSWCSTASNSIEVTVNPLPIVSVTANPPILCLGGTSQLKAVVAGTLEAVPTYCTSNLTGANYCGNGNLTNVTIIGTTLNNNSVCNYTPEIGNYTAYAASGSTTAVLVPGQTYTISVSAEAASVSMFIDYNQNGQFEPVEWTQVYTYANAGTASFTVPSNASLGATGMRVRSRYSGYENGAANVCTTMGSGSTDDYIITIGNPTLFSYNWVGSPATNVSDATTSNPVATLTSSSDTYTVAVSDLASGCTSTGNVTIQNISVSAVSLTVGGANSCVGTQTVSAAPIGGVAPYTYSWSEDGVAFGTNAATVTASAGTHLYACTVTDNCGSSASSSLSATTYSRATITPTTVVLCGGNPAIATAGPAGATYSWSGGLGNAQTATLTASGDYTVTVTQGTCVTSATASAQVTSSPTITASSNSPVCEGGDLNLTSTGVVTQTVDGNYSIESIAFAPVTPLTAASAGPAGDDVVSAAIPIGFNFSYYGTTYTNVYISTNGFISFDSSAGSGCCTGQLLPNAGNPNAVIALDWMDLNTGRGGTIDYFNLTSPNRFVVRFNGVATFENTGTVSGEIIIYDSGIIEIHNTAITTTGSAQTQGIEDPTGTLATTVPGRNRTAWNATADAFRFSPPVGVGTYAWTGPNAFSVQNPSIASASTTDSGTYTLTFTDPFGCTASTTVDALVNPVSSTTETIVACSSYEWHGNTYTASNNTATWTGTNAAGCDSIVTLNLTINQPSYTTETIVACGSYEWHGTTYSSSTNNNIGGLIFGAPTWTGTNAAGCDSIVTLNLTINQPSYFTETIVACGSYEWHGTIYTSSTNDNGGIFGPGAGSLPTWTGTNSAGCDSIVSLNLTINPLPTPTISGTLAFCAGGSTTLDAGAGYASYLWSTGATTQTISVSNATSVSVTVTNAAGCSGTSASVTPTVNALSTAPTSITSSVAFASAGVNFTLSVNGGSLGTGASWKWYKGSCGGTLIGTGASISVSQTANTAYFVRAEGTCNTTACATITVNSQCGATSINSSAGTTAVCAGSAVTLTPVGVLAPGAQWRWDDDCDAVPSTSDASATYTTASSFNVNPTSTTTYYLQSVGGVCGVTACIPVTINVIAKPATPGTISGSASVCPSTSVTYTIAAVAGATSYTWTAPTNATLVSAQGGTSMTVAYAGAFTSGTLKVKANNCSGSSSDKSLSIAKQASPAAPASIAGSASVCPSTSVTYTIASVTNATSYTWVAPANATLASAQGSTSMTINYGSAFVSGTLSVTAVGCGGSSAAKTLSITKLAVPATPGNISGASAPCKGSTQTYSTSAVSSATSYTWTLPTGVSFVSGTSQTGTSIQVVVASTFNSGTLSVKANNCGGSSSNRTTTLTGQSAPTAPGTITGPSSVTQNTANNTFSVSNVAGMTYNWTVPAGCTITLGQGTSTIKVTWGTVAGNVSVTSNNGCGNSVASTKSVSVKRSAEAEANAGMESARTEETVETLVTTADELSAIAVYPNPTTGEARITFNTTSAGKYAISIVDLQGRVINSTSGAATEGNNTLDINLSNCSNGVYMIHLMHNDSLQTMRVVKM